VKRQFTMQKRPQISDVQRERITEIFDKDLQIVGDWLGIELTCESFKNGIYLG